jgi:signal transduction histidine kinase
VPDNQSAVNERALVSAFDEEGVENADALGWPRLGRRDAAIGVGALAGAAVAAVVVVTGGVSAEPTSYAVLLVANILTFAVAGALWLHSRPRSALGVLLLGAALLKLLSSLSGSPQPTVYFVGVLAEWAAAFLSTWLMLSFPGVRLDRGARVVVGIALASFLAGELPYMLTTQTIQGLPGVGRCAGAACPDNVAFVAGSDTLSHALRDVEGIGRICWAAALLAYLILRLLAASRPRRRVLIPLYCAALPFAVAFGLNALLVDVLGHEIRQWPWLMAAFIGTRLLFPFGFIAALLLAQAYAGAALATMARELGGGPSIGDVQRLVRRVLDDPSASLAFWLPRSRQFVDRHGRRVTLDPAEESKTWSSFGHGSDPLLAVVYDPVLSEDPELVEAVGAASVLALENRRLQQDLIDSVDALRASQRRLVMAASSERRKIERNLHDGTQQKLVALRIQLELAREEAPDGSAVESRLATLGGDFDDVLADLRSVAHGIYPPLLADEGLPAALQDAARRAVVPVALDLQDVGRLQEDREAAIYYCCLEALQNVAKHAGDSAVVTLRLWRDERAVRFSIVDNGAGFVRRPRLHGAGLTNMSDRIGAVGGSLVIQSAPGEGTTIEGRLGVSADERVEDHVLGA